MSKTNTITYQVSDSKVDLEIYQGKAGGLTYFHPHEDEVTSYKVAKEIVDEYGGVLYSIVQNGERCLSVEYKNKIFIFDPNRMFTKDGIKNDLLECNEEEYNIEQELIDSIYEFSTSIYNQISSNTDTLFAVHNNFNEDYNIESYLSHGTRLKKGVRDVCINQDQSLGDFFYVNGSAKDIFDAGCEAGYNCVLASDEMDNDGSLSVLTCIQGMMYVNCEVERGYHDKQYAMLEFINQKFVSLDNTHSREKQYIPDV